jgi:hypothetical protein
MQIRRSQFKRFVACVLLPCQRNVDLGTAAAQRVGLRLRHEYRIVGLQPVVLR